MELSGAGGSSSRPRGGRLSWTWEDGHEALGRLTYKSRPPRCQAASFLLSGRNESCLRPKKTSFAAGNVPIQGTGLARFVGCVCEGSHGKERDVGERREGGIERFVSNQGCGRHASCPPTRPSFGLSNRLKDPAHPRGWGNGRPTATKPPFG